MIIQFVCVDIRAIQVRHDTNTCRQNIPQNFTRRVGEVLRLLQSNTGHANFVGHGVKAVDGWNNEQHGHF